MKNRQGRPGALGWCERGGLWLGKGAAALSRLSGRGGSTLPGRVAGAVAPGLFPALARQVRRCNLVLTGTNGKTTTSHLLASVLREAGLEVIHNRTGANLAWGIASTFIGSANWSGRLSADAGIMESDEAAFPGVVRAARPQAALVTNIFRDQLDRYGEVDRIREMIREGLSFLPAGSWVLLNADDPAVTGMTAGMAAGGCPAGSAVGSAAGLKNGKGPGAGRGPRVLFYGLELDLPAAGYLNTARDLKACPLCGEQLIYSALYFAHLGRYRCAACSFHRPKPHFRLVRRTVETDGRAAVTVACPGETLRFTYPLPGIYNLYNCLAAAACARLMGVKSDMVEAGLAGAFPSFGRMERFHLEGRPVVMGLMKNPVGGNEVLRTFLEAPGPLNLLIAINDNYADGTDISWLWDVDFEQVEQSLDRITTMTVSGLRALDMAVRLKYAGVPPSRIVVESNLEKALDRSLNAPAGEPLCMVLTYTAMLGLRRIIHRRGAVRPYWEEQKKCLK